MVVKVLETQEIEYDLMMVANRLGLAIDKIVASGEDITPYMAYQLESMDASRKKLEEHISTTVSPKGT